MRPAHRGRAESLLNLQTEGTCDVRILNDIRIGLGGQRNRTVGHAAARILVAGRGRGTVTLDRATGELSISVDQLMGTTSVAIVSDIHYAASAEQARHGHELRVIRNPVLRMGVAAYRRYFWLRDPFEHNHMLDRFIHEAAGADLVVANGDYSCDTAFVGVSDEAALASARTCLERLRAAFPGRVHAAFGDHELGKLSLFGGCGGLRVASWHRAVNELGLKPFWQVDVGRYRLMAVVSSLLALPVFEPETLPAERDFWRALRESHLAAIQEAFGALAADHRVILFCHDPSALPFLAQEDEVARRLGQIEMTIIGHLHTRLIFRPSRWLAGMPPIRFLGNSIRRMSEALHEARVWRHFNVQLCPSLAGSELLRDGGYGTLELTTTDAPAQWRFHPLDW